MKSRLMARLGKRMHVRIGVIIALAISTFAISAAPANASQFETYTNVTTGLTIGNLSGTTISTYPWHPVCDFDGGTIAHCEWIVSSLGQTGCAGTSGICGDEKIFYNWGSGNCWQAKSGTGTEWPMIASSSCSSTNGYNIWIVRFNNADHTNLTFANAATGRCLATSSGHGVVTEACSQNNYQKWT